MKILQPLKSVFAATALLSLSGCADIVLAARGQPSLFNGFKRRAPAPKEPGLYGSVDRWNRGQDVNGEVGHQVSVSAPQAECINTNGGRAGDWSSDTSVVSGILPPGLSMDSGGEISGIPTERGHWVVTLRDNNITCNGSRYDDMAFTQELIFHITGSGQVIQ